MVPEGWKQTTLNALGRWKGGGTPRKDNSSFWENGIFPWVSPKDMKCGYISNSKDKITFEAIKNSATNVIASHSLLFVTRSGILRKVAPIAINTCEVTINQDIKALIVNEERADVKYIAHTLWCFNTKLLFLCSKEGTTVESIDLSALKSFPILLPPLPEQKKIARILSTWDKAIETVDKLIENSKQQKKALMQQLLTGKKRLPGFSGEWKSGYLGNHLSKIVGGGTPSKTRPSYWKGTIPWITVKDFTSLEIKSSVDSITNAGLENSAAKLIPAGTVVLCVRMAVGKVAMTYQDMAINQDLKALFPQLSLLDDFLFYFMQLHCEHLERLGTGSTVKGISISDVKNIKFPFLPCTEEQRAIISCLKKYDKNIITLEHRIMFLRKEKQALMQQLLTGKRRVTVTE
jgi:type I restriction enzyme S subunit